MNLETDNKIQKKGITLVIPNPCGNIKETKMKNSGVEWIGEIPEDWEVRKVKHSFIRKNEKAIQENPTVLSLARSGVKERDISNNEGQLAESYYNYNPVDIDDLLINPMDLYSGANCSISKVKGVISPAYINLRAKKNVSPVFYDYYFKVQYWMMAFFAHGNGVSFENRWTLNNETLQNYPIVAPSFETQQRIASYLDKKCSKIEETIQNQQQVIEKLKAYKQSLITEAVTGKVKIVNGKACGEYESYKGSRLKWLGDFYIPEKWNSIQVKSCVSIPVVDGPHESPELLDNGIPYISATAIENSKIDFSLKRGFISEKYCDECDKRYKPMKDDILMIKLGATTGQVAIVETDERFNIWVPLAAIRCNKNIALPKFVFYSFQSDYCLKQMEMSWTFGTQQTLGVSSIERLKIFLPNIETQKEIAGYLDKKCTAIDTAIEQKQKLIEKLTEYKKSLIYECVTGKKEI